jgi:propane monooxygenase small subunit
VVFEPLVGELFRSHLVQHAAPRNGDFVTPTVVGAEEYDYAERDLRYARPVHTDDRTIFVANPEDAADYLGFDLTVSN